MSTNEPQNPQKAIQTESQKKIDGKSDEWENMAPYRAHDVKADFTALYEASCHCGRVEYQLSRKKPLDAKYCHCKTCQRLHGELGNLKSAFFGRK
jgi:hypothetical protein